MLKLSSNSLLEISRAYAKEIIDGLNRSVTPFHAVDYCRKKLLDNEFSELKEK